MIKRRKPRRCLRGFCVDEAIVGWAKALQRRAHHLVGSPGTAELRAALRDKLERGKDVYPNNGLPTMSPTDHNGYDERSAFLVKVERGKFRLVK